MQVTNIRANGFTIIELAATVAAVTVLAATAMPLAASVQGRGDRDASRLNLESLHQVHTMYALDHEDRQFSHLPDDFTGNTAVYQIQHGCIDPLVLGSDRNGALWGFYLSCGAYPGNNGNIVMYIPMSFTAPLDGLYRMGNTRKVNEYANGRFYDPLFFAPDDPSLGDPEFKAMRAGLDFEFTGTTGMFGYTSYDLSPAAMWAPRVLGDGQKLKSATYRAPSAAFQDYRTPRVSQCQHPSLKTRMLEHYAMNNAPAPCNPHFAGCVPYMWNQSAATRNLALFYDGSVSEFGVLETLEAEDAVGADLWLRNTPLGPWGVYGDHAVGGPTSGAHFLTTFGIRGRDRIAAP
ncbi:MAG: hypothetical protein ACOYMM_01190 [Phycisphaerales bacterium]